MEAGRRVYHCLFWMSLFIPIHGVILGCKDKSRTDTGAKTLEAIFSGEQQWSIPQESAEWWTEIDESSNTYAGAGVLVEDIDGNGLLDLLLLRRNGNRLLLQQEDGWVASPLPVIEGIACNGSIVDFDQDGDMDILINTIWGNDVLLIQDRLSWDVIELPSPVFSAGSAWYDINKDGLLDVSIAGYGNDQAPEFGEAFDAGASYAGENSFLFLQNTDHDLLESNLLPSLPINPFTFNLAWLPLNGDVYWDLFSVNDFGMLNGGHQVFWNEQGTLSLSTEILGLEREMFGMGLAVTDLNADQRPDLSISNIGNIVSLLSDSGTWYDSALSFGFEATEDRHTCWGIDWGDVNNDGQMDLWLGCGPLPLNGDPNFYNPQSQPDALFVWTPEGYQEVASSWAIDSHSNTRAGGFVDLNRDGCLDLIRVAVDGPAEIFEGTCSGNWINIRLNDGMHGIGSQIEVITEATRQTAWMMAGGTSFATFLPLERHFGLGTSQSVDLRITWADGFIQTLSNIEVNQHLEIERTN